MTATSLPPGTSPESDGDFDAQLARIGHAIPPGRRKGLYLGYVDMKRQAAIIRGETMGAELEPANTFSLVPYTMPAPKGE